MEHSRYESHRRGLVGIILGEFEHQFERPPLPRRIVRTEYHGLPYHDVGIHGRAGDAGRRIVLQSTKVAQQTTTCAGGHDDDDAVLIDAAFD